MTKVQSKNSEMTTADSKAPVKKQKVQNSSNDSCCKCMSQYITLIIMVFGLTFLFLKRNDLNINFFSVSGKGEVSVRHFVDDLNTMMCEAYEVTTTFDFLDVYLTSGKAKVDGPRNGLQKHGSQLFPKGYDTDNSFYLLEGSNIKVNACRLHESTGRTVHVVDLLIFKGDDSWEKFEKGSCDDCPLRNKTLPMDTYCEDGRESVLTYNVDDRDTYYIAVVKRSEGYNTDNIFNIKDELEIEQMTFDTRNAKKVCSRASQCIVPLKYASDVDVVVNSTGSAFISTNCHLRVIFCVGIFVIFPVCLIALGFCCCIAVIVSEKKEKVKREQNRKLDNEEVSVKDKSGLVDNELPPAYDSINPA